jgi:hypothetical protein
VNSVVVRDDLNFSVHQAQACLPLPRIAAQVSDAADCMIMPPTRRTTAGERSGITLRITGVSMVRTNAMLTKHKNGTAAVGIALRNEPLLLTPKHQRGTLGIGAQMPA